MYYLFIMRQVICWFVLHWKLVCLHWKKTRFTAFLDSNLHTRLAIVTENELGLAFPPRNLPKKFRPDPSTFYLIIVVTNKQTDRQTNAGDSIILRFRGDNYKTNSAVLPQQISPLPRYYRELGPRGTTVKLVPIPAVLP